MMSAIETGGGGGGTGAAGAVVGERINISRRKNINSRIRCKGSSSSSSRGRGGIRRIAAVVVGVAGSAGVRGSQMCVSRLASSAWERLGYSQASQG